MVILTVSIQYPNIQTSSYYRILLPKIKFPAFQRLLVPANVPKDNPSARTAPVCIVNSVVPVIATQMATLQLQVVVLVKMAKLILLPHRNHHHHCKD